MEDRAHWVTFAFYNYRYNKPITRFHRYSMLYLHFFNNGLVVEEIKASNPVAMKIKLSGYFGLTRRKLLQSNYCSSATILHSKVPYKAIQTRMIPRCDPGKLRTLVRAPEQHSQQAYTCLAVVVGQLIELVIEGQALFVIEAVELDVCCPRKGSESLFPKLINGRSRKAVLCLAPASHSSLSYLAATKSNGKDFCFESFYQDYKKGFFTRTYNCKNLYEPLPDMTSSRRLYMFRNISVVTGYGARCRSAWTGIPLETVEVELYKTNGGQCYLLRSRTQVQKVPRSARGDNVPQGANRGL